jgi:hypothetical protein
MTRANLDYGSAEMGQRIQIAIRNHAVDAVTTSMPFYKRDN